jgi:sulfur-oxidizing protein SoxZ
VGDRIRIRARLADGAVDAQILMPHPMETGLRKDDAGTFVPAHYITHVQVTVAGRSVLEARMSIAMSRDPLLSFRFRGASEGERVTVTWTDNRGDRRSDETLITT